MLLSLSQWLQSLSPELGFLRVFQYLTLRAVLAAMTALLVGLVDEISGNDALLHGLLDGCMDAAFGLSDDISAMYFTHSGDGEFSLGV